MSPAVHRGMLDYPTLEVVSAPTHDQLSTQWMMQHELVSTQTSAMFNRIGCGTFAAATYPEAPPWVVQLASDLTSFLFTFDDFIAEGVHRFDPDGMRREAAPYLDLVRGERARVSTAYARALEDLVARATRQAPAFWRPRLVASFEAYVEGCAQEAVWRRRGQVPSLAEYLVLRRGSVAVNPMMDLMELKYGVFLSPASFASPLVAQLRELGSDLSAYVNDIQSVEKEEALGEVCNSVIVVEHERRLSRDAALDAVSALHNARLAELLALEQGLERRSPGSAEALYARSIRQFVHGHYGWILSSKRYIPLSS